MLASLNDWQKLSLDEMAARLAALPKDARDQVTREVLELTKDKKWIPIAGPQLAAFLSPASVLFYGGSAGGGKTSLILGLALTEHNRSLIIRQQYNDLDALTEELLNMNGSRAGYNGSNPPSLRTADGRFIQFSGATMGQWQGQAFDLKCFDEVVQIPEEVVSFHIGWLRTTKEGQRTRVVMASNPPVSSVGDWIVPMFRPWLDITHPKPALDGELRWFARAPDGENVEVDGPAPVQFPGADKPVAPMSRTFIRARLGDNPYLSKSDYASRLDQMEEPYRSAMRDGNFMNARADQEFQVIPSAWIAAAQKRWNPKPPRDARMTAIGADVGAGGIDRVVLAPLYGTWFAPLIVAKGRDAPDGPAQAGLIATHRRDNCVVVVDVGGGYGGDLCTVLKSNEVRLIRFDGSAAALGKARDGTKRAFENKRAEGYWRLREALNPDQQGGSSVELPGDDLELRAELAAVAFLPDGRHIQIEPKLKVKARLGRSPDKADAVVMAWYAAESAARRQNAIARGDDMPDQANIGYANLKRH